MIDPDQRTIKCRVCREVTEADLLELDLLMGDPSRWPVTVWGMFEPPRALTASYRRFGAMEMGAAFLTDHGYDIEKGQLRRHYKYDVPKIAGSPDELVANGLIASTSTKDSRIPEVIDPTAYVRYYAKGIEVGITGLQLLQDRVNAIRSKNEEVPLALIKMLIDNGVKLATSQAAIVAAGRRWGNQDDIDDGFMSGSAPTPSPRMGHHRVRVVDGVSMPVADEGPADREHYTERARQEGGEGLPHR